MGGVHTHAIVGPWRSERKLVGVEPLLLPCESQEWNSGHLALLQDLYLLSHLTGPKTIMLLEDKPLWLLPAPSATGTPGSRVLLTGNSQW